jgi:hypothetical protein
MSIQHVNAISNRLSRRPPQRDLLEILARVCEIVSLNLSACGHAQAGMDGDWQLGMPRHFFSEGVQERFAQSRFDAIRELGRIAKGENCHFMVVCGDVFESNLVDRKTVSRAFEALKDLPLSVYLLPGNRAQLRAEIDVYVAHLYGLSRDDLVYILDTFPVLKKNEKEAFGEFMSKRKCMEEYDRIGKIMNAKG